MAAVLRCSLFISDAGELPRDALGSDALVALAAAAARDVLVLVVDAGVEAERPLQVLVCGTSAQAYCQTRLAVLAGEGSSLSLKQSLVSLSGESTAEELVCCNTRVLLGRGARLQHAYAQELSLNSRHVEVLSAEVPANALYTLTTLLTGARIGRVNAYVNLNEPDANCTVTTGGRPVNITAA
jgi:Fe-S cluster assembly scaffold protein SufB